MLGGAVSIYRVDCHTVECPVCGTNLAALQPSKQEEQENHVAMRSRPLSEYVRSRPERSPQWVQGFVHQEHRSAVVPTSQHPSDLFRDQVLHLEDIQTVD